MIFVLLLLFGGIFISIYIYGIIKRSKSGVCTCPSKMTGKTVIITGASAGLGKYTAKVLAEKGARVILACRNVEKAEKIKEWIVSLTGNKNIHVRHVDISDFTSVRKFASETLKQEDRIDVLINNAGVYHHDKQVSKQGLEMTIATNHFGHFLLTNLLLGRIKQCAPSRIINVSSSAHNYFSLDFDDIHFNRRKYSGYEAYAQSKLCNILFTKELAHHLGLSHGEGVTVNALHPGFVDTDIVNREKQAPEMIFKILGKIVGKDAELGSQTTIHLAVSEKVANISGEYFVDCEIAEPSKKALDPGLAKKLWELSEEEVALTKDEIHF